MIKCNRTGLSWYELNDTEYKLLRWSSENNAFVGIREIKRFDEGMRAFISSYIGRDVQFIKIECLSGIMDDCYDNDVDYLYIYARNNQIVHGTDSLELSFTFPRPLTEQVTIRFNMFAANTGDGILYIYKGSVLADVIGCEVNSINTFNIPVGTDKVVLGLTEDNPQRWSIMEVYFWHTGTTVYKLY